VWDEDYVRVLNGAKIGLGLLTHLAPDESTTRTFEIPACGTMLLAERSREHSELFEEGKEAEFFTSDGEMQEKIRWYLSHERERNQIAAAGREKVVKSGCSYLERMRSAVAAIDLDDGSGPSGCATT
jgi:spore maturation protein CgeB